MGLSSLLLINPSELPAVISENIKFILDGICSLSAKLTEIKERKKNKANNDEEDYDDEYDFDEKLQQYLNNQGEDNDILEGDDINNANKEGDHDDDLFGDDYDDEDWDIEDYHKQTVLEGKDEFVYLRDVFSHVRQGFPEYYGHLMTIIPVEKQQELDSDIKKAEERLNQSIKAVSNQ